YFFSSRRRHTRSKRDLSSDVCSSDLILSGFVPVTKQLLEEKAMKNRIKSFVSREEGENEGKDEALSLLGGVQNDLSKLRKFVGRSEERRVGNEGIIRTCSCK